jgi:hypothetical protein
MPQATIMQFYFCDFVDKNVLKYYLLKAQTNYTQDIIRQSAWY